MLTAMTTANFVFLISMSIEPEIWEYKGHFLDCNQAMILTASQIVNNSRD